MSQPRHARCDQRTQPEDAEQDQTGPEVGIEGRAGERGQGQRHDLAARSQDQHEATAEGAQAQEDFEHHQALGKSAERLSGLCHREAARSWAIPALQARISSHGR